MDSWLAGLKGTLNLWDAHRVKVYNKEFRAEHPEYFDPDGIMVFCGPQGSGKTLSMIQYAYRLSLAYPDMIICTNVELHDWPPVRDIIQWEGMKSLSEVENGFAGVLFLIDEIQLEFNFADKDCDWVRVYVSYNQYNNTNQIWSSNNTPSSYTVPINLSDIPANLNADHAQDILTALNNINSSVTAADKAARQRLEAINNSINNNYNDLTRPSDSAVSSASDSLSDTSEVESATGLFTSIDNLTQGVFNLFANPGSTTLTFPGFGLEVDGVSYNVWEDTTYNLTDIDDKFGGLMSVVRFATTLLVYLALIRYLVNTYHRIFGEGD